MIRNLPKLRKSRAQRSKSFNGPRHRGILRDFVHNCLSMVVSFGEKKRAIQMILGDKTKDAMVKNIPQGIYLKVYTKS